MGGQVTAESTVAPREAGWCPWCLCKGGHGSVLTVAGADGTAETWEAPFSSAPWLPYPQAPSLQGSWTSGYGRQLERAVQAASAWGQPLRSAPRADRLTGTIILLLSLGLLETVS